MVFPRPIEIMYQIEGCIYIRCWLLNMSALVVTYVAYEEYALKHAETIYGP